MKRIVLILTALLWLSYGMAQPDACQEGWKQLFLRSRQLHEVQSDFVQTRTVSFLASPEVQRGHLSFKSPYLIRWTYADAESNAAASPHVTSIVQSWLKGDTASLDKSFTQSCTEFEGDGWLQLIPKDRRLKPYIQHILLKINTRGDVIEVYVLEKSGDNTRIQMRNMKCY